MIAQYLSRLIRTWVLWVFLIADAIAFLVGAIDPTVQIGRSVCWFIAAAGFVAANFDIFRKLTAENAHLRTSLQEKDSVLGNLVLRIRSVRFAHTHPVLTMKGRYEDGINTGGMPVEAIVTARLEVENTGFEPGELAYHLDLQATDIPGFVVDRRNVNGHFRDLPASMEGRRRWEGNWILECNPQPSDPAEFASLLSNADTFRLALSYSTKRVGGDSPEQLLLIEGSLADYKKSVAKRWRARGLHQLADKATSPPAA